MLTRPLQPRRPKYAAAAVVVLLLVGGSSLAYVNRHAIRDAWTAFRAPSLPPASGYIPNATNSESDGASGQDVTTPFEGGYSTSANYVLETAPAQKPPAPASGIDPLAFTGDIPAEKNLDVPFTTQAPFAHWDYPYEEACEEASSIMVDAYYDGRTGTIPPAEADAAILDFIAYEKETLGFYEDTTAQQTADAIKGHLGYRNVIVAPVKTADDIKRIVAQGYPVIVPAAGKLLGNPNFRGGGPAYHMVVVRGYTSKYFITNDPGTRNGRSYTYTFDTLLNAIHDWVGSPETIEQGPKVMLIVLPNE